MIRKFPTLTSPRHTLDVDKGVYGYEILDLVGNIVMWPMCVALILVRNQSTDVLKVKFYFIF